MIPAPRFLTLASLFGLACAFSGVPARAQEIWNGPATVFSKAAGANPTLPENQDQITPLVALTRGGLAGLYNAVSEGSYATGSPAGTEWAAGDIADYATLTYLEWKTAVDNCPPCQINVPFVVHLIAEDIYIPIMVTAWGQGTVAGGSFTYTRGTQQGVATRPVSWSGLKAGPPTAPLRD